MIKKNPKELQEILKVDTRENFTKISKNIKKIRQKIAIWFSIAYPLPKNAVHICEGIF